jgi:uncharacterized protein HemY
MDRINTLIQWLEDEPADTFLLFALAKEYANRQLWTEAEMYFLRVLVLDADYTGAYYHFGQLLVQTGRDQDAIQCFEKGIKVCQRVGDVKTLHEIQAELEEMNDE